MRLVPARSTFAFVLPVAVALALGGHTPAHADPGYHHTAAPDAKPVPMTKVPVRAANMPNVKMVTGAVPNATWPTSATAAVSGKIVQSATVSSTAHIEFLDRAASDRAGVPGVLLRVGAPAGAKTKAVADARVPLRIDYRSFRNLYGGDWASRLHAVVLPACALTTPTVAACAGKPLAGTNDYRSGTLSTTPTLAADGTALVALEGGDSGPDGDFGATDIAPSSTWQAGGSTGDFTWSYPLRMPPALGGAAPKVSFNYSSQSVDGRTSATNNQPSWLGEGFDYSPGYVERKYKNCVDDMGGDANNSKKTGDFCQSDGSSVVLSLGGSATELLYNATDKYWHPKKDDGTKVERLTDASFANGDNDNEYWKATTADGVQYWFGRNRLPGWSTGKPETKSVYTVPVAGNNPNETCHQSAFVDSFCDEGWRWNLDYVVDPHQNTLSYWYTPEDNRYGRNNDATKHSKYTRGGMLTRIDYGTRTDDIFGTAPAQVLFAPGNRCSSATACDIDNKDQWKNWLDTPLDKRCKENTDCKDNLAPTFWTTTRLAKVTTQVWGGSGYRPVDSWTLRASWTEPLDGNHAGLWLAGITHTGLVGSTSITLPETVLTGTKMNNRVDSSSDDIYAYAWPRLTSIRSETGGETSVFYTDPECAAGSVEPDKDHLDTNQLRCYPVKWTPDGFENPITDYFHKYVLRAVTETDLTGGSPPVKTAYEYIGQPAWHYDEYDGLVKKSRLTWGEWRGYDGVRILKGETGEQTRTETTYFRGLDGDKTTGGKRDVSLPAVDTSPAAPDSDAFAGMVREERTYNNDKVISASVSTPWQSAATASRTVDGVVTEAHFVNVAATRNRTLRPLDNTWRRTTKNMTYDNLGMLTQTDDAGDDDVVGSDTIAGDETCVKTTYARNLDTWILDRASKTETYARPCSVAPKTADDVIGITRNFFDGSLTAGAAPSSAGDLTRVESLATWTSPTSMTFVAQQRAHYDAYGRTDQAFDLSGTKRTTTYDRVTGGGVNKVTVTAVADSKVHTTSSEFDPAWGAQTAATDENDNRTDISLDALGRTAAVWQPGRDRSAGANAVFTYTMRTDGVVSTRTDSLNAAGNYVTSYTLYDSLLRQRQVQGDSPTPKSRLVTETRYNSAGNAVLQLGPVVNSNAPGKDLATVEADLVYPQTRTTYDQAGRATAEIFQPRGTELWRTTTVYGGDRTDKIPPAGGTATETVTNAIGKTTALKQYAPGKAADSGTVTTYGYNRKGELAMVTGPDGGKWEYKRDVRGRIVQTKDPDKGQIDYTFDAADRMATMTDARGASSALKYSYDGLGRKIGIYDKATNAKRATWAYDSAPGGKGKVASTSRWVGTAEYKTAVRGYNPRGLSTGTTTTLPDAEGALAGDYTFIIGYNNTTDSSVSGYTYGGRGDLMPETIFYNYDPASGLPASVDSDYPGTNAYVKSTSYSGVAQPTGFVLTTDKHGATETYRDYIYDPVTGRLDHSPASTTSGGVVSDPHYGYDPAGNVTRISDPLNGSGTADTQCFTQDYLQRLTEAWTPADGDCDPAKRSVAGLGGPAKYWQSWTYDDAGNRLSQTDHGAATGDLVTDYHPFAGKHALASTTGAMAGTYDYDDIGDLKRRPSANGDQTLTWDAEDHLASVTTGSATTSYIYDAGGTRLLRKDPAVTTLYLGDVEIRLTKATNLITETRSYKWADQTVAQRTKAGVTWLVNDRQGTANILIDAATQHTTVRHQSPFGGPRGAASSWPTQRGFLGGQDDPSGLTHLGARDYDPVTGRFVSVDPVLDNSDPQQMNGYAYADNNPISSCDPTGERPYEDPVTPGGGGSDSEYSVHWSAIFKIPHDLAIAERVRQIKVKWPHARVTITQADNFIREGSAKGNNKPGYADLICWDCDPGRIYIWEMKHKGGDAEAEGPAQLTRYVNKLQTQIQTDAKYAGDSSKRVVKGPKFGVENNSTIPNPTKPGSKILVEDGEADGIQVYSFQDDDKEPTPKATPTATASPEPTSTEQPRLPGRTPTPSTTGRAPELPENDGIKVGAPSAKTVLTVVAVVAVVAVVVVACIVLAPVATAVVAVAAGIGALFSW